jgi:hypothetical protein
VEPVNVLSLKRAGEFANAARYGQQKSRRDETPCGVHHVGLLINEPAGGSCRLSDQSSGNCQHRSLERNSVPTLFQANRFLVRETVTLAPPQIENSRRPARASALHLQV